jgi:protein ERP2
MLNKLNLNLVIFSLINLFIPLYTFDIELTVLIPANNRECFHQILETGKTIEIEYEVLAGGDLDINYWFYSPTNRILQSDFKKRDGHQTIKLEETGEYRFCLDNSFSRFSQKQVYFSLRPVNEEGQNGQVTESWMNTVDKDELGDLQSKIQDIKVRNLSFK